MTTLGEAKSTLASSRIGLGALLTFATLLFGLSVRASSPKAGLAVAFGTLLLAAALWNGRNGHEDRDEPRRRDFRLFLAVVVFAAFGVAGWAPWNPENHSQLLERLPFIGFGAFACWVFLSRTRDLSRSIVTATAVGTVALTVVVGMLHLNNTQDFGVDVFWLHRAAAEAIANGENPYSDAVRVENGAPTSSPGDMIAGYPYPPVTAVAYSIGEWAAGDARYTSLVSWAGLLSILGWAAHRRQSRTHLYVMLLLASVPGWPLVLRAGWTEPFSLLLLAAAFVTWRHPSRSGGFLGLGLASKQYFAVALPVALLHRDSSWKQRLGCTALLVVMTILPAILLDPNAFWTSAVDFHLNTPLRRDSVNITGVFAAFGGSFAPPRWLGPVAGVAVGVVAGRISRNRQTFFLGTALTLSVVFLFASQALANYWLLITGICALALLPGHVVGDAVGAPDTTLSRQ